MINKTHTIVLNDGETYYKLCKIIYGADGSIFITSPYHPSKEAIVFLATVNYALQEIEVPFEEFIDAASIDDDNKRLKLTHHTSGLIQVSGEGITSGIDENGNIKGIGIRSWPLESPVRGPAFGATIYGFEHFKQVTKIGKDFHIFSIHPYQKIQGFRALSIEGHCFPAHYRRFVREDAQGHQFINVTHPSGMVMPLRIAFPPVSCVCQSFPGIELYFTYGAEDQPIPSYYLSSSTGNLRRNEKGHLLGDNVSVMYPRQDIPVRRDLNFYKDNQPEA